MLGVLAFAALLTYLFTADVRGGRPPLLALLLGRSWLGAPRRLRTPTRIIGGVVVDAGEIGGIQYLGAVLLVAVLVTVSPASGVTAIDRPGGTDAPALDLANESVRRGQSIAVLGNALGFTESISPGVVTDVDTAVSVVVAPWLNLTISGTVQTDASAPFGSSGGRWVNCDGEVVAVMHAGALLFDASFGIPGAPVRQVVPTLAAGENVTRSLLGARTIDVGPELAEATDLSVTRGAYVVDVPPWSPAAGQLQGSPAVHRQTGLPYGGDVILSVDGTRIQDNEDLLSDLVLETRPNETVTMTVLRDGANETVTVTLGERPQAPPTGNVSLPVEPTAVANETTTTTATG